MSFDAELALKITKAFENVREYNPGDDIKLANVIKRISDLGKDIDDNKVFQTLSEVEMQDVAEEYLRLSK